LHLIGDLFKLNKTLSSKSIVIFINGTAQKAHNMLTQTPSAAVPSIVQTIISLKHTDTHTKAINM